MTWGDDHTAVRVRIHGRVQGVWYRAWTAQMARKLGLAGWVRNRRDGTVEAVFSGPVSAVEEMIAACRDGPPAARVETIDQQPEQGPVPPGFCQRPTV